MTIHFNDIRYLILLTSALLTGSCAIENDIPYPTVDGSVTTTEMYGQSDA